MERLSEHLKALDRQVDELEQQIQAWDREQAMSRKLAEISGIGPLAASALVPSIDDAKSFENGRQLAAWLGPVPRPHSGSGERIRLQCGCSNCQRGGTKNSRIVGFQPPIARAITP